jgi:exonuclease 3'-5' domain-containing protein 1
LINIAVSCQVYLIDVLKIGYTAYDGGLCSILEDRSIQKLMFDCREDADALKHLYNVGLDGVLDVQLLEVMIPFGSCYPTSFIDNSITKCIVKFEKRKDINTCIF